ncbi:MAG: radical SAM protein [bacterium]
MRPKIEKVVVDPNFRNATLPLEISKRLGIAPEFMSKSELVEFVKENPGEDIFKTAKKILFFTENKGKFLKKCPGSRGVVCCDYYTINSVTGCPYDCSYCILQHYIENNPFITIFLNREKAIDEIEEFLLKQSWLRVGTGELADSLALDHLLDESGFFLSEIEKRNLTDKVQFEFKTKSAEVDRLIEVFKKHKKVNTVAGFSVNIPKFQEKEEPGTESIEKRIEAAQKVIKAGIKVAIHFDPIVMVEHYFHHYLETINSIFSALDCSQVVWISMGGFRHTLTLTETIQKRFPESVLFAGEMFPSEKDNKLRYLSSVRRNYYKAFIQEISNYFNGEPPLYICMEKSFIWQDLKLPFTKAVFP